MGKILGFLRSIRPLNCVVKSFAILVGASLTGLGNMNWQNLLYGAVSVFSLTGAAMAVNDYHDVDKYKINEPNRPIPGGDQ